MLVLVWRLLGVGYHGLIGREMLSPYTDPYIHPLLLPPGEELREGALRDCERESGL